MHTFRASWLTTPQGDAKISEGTFGYLAARVRQRAYDIVVREFKRSGLSKAQFARRWGKDPAIVTRFLARPGNWEIDTYTEALFAISGAIPQFSLVYVDRAMSRPPEQIDTEKPVTKSETLSLPPKPKVNNPQIRLLPIEGLKAA